MRFRRARVTPEATFDLTNLIDVVLLLIIFFMLTAQFAQTQRSGVDLPRAKGDEGTATADAEVVVDLMADGTLRMDGEVVRLDRMQQAVKSDVARLAESGKGVEVVVRADRSCAAVHLNALASALAGIEVRRWRLGTSGEGSR